MQLHKVGLPVFPQNRLADVFGITTTLWECAMSELQGQTVEEITILAKEMELVAIFLHPPELLLDLDEPYATAVLKMQAKLANGDVTRVLRNNRILVLSQLYTKSKNGNAHLYLFLSEGIDNMERIVIQAALGSDSAREIWNMLRERMHKEGEYSVALFETEDQAALVRSWRIMNKIELARK